MDGVEQSEDHTGCQMSMMTNGVAQNEAGSVKDELSIALLTLREARDILQEWIDQQGHSRCWYYPEIFRKLAGKLGVVASREPALPEREAFREGCRRYEKEEYEKLVIEDFDII